MRYLRRQILSKNTVTGQNSAYIDISGEAVIDQPYSLLVPKGTTSERPLSPVTGMIRFNTTIGEFEAYQGSSWRSLRYKEATGIVLQDDLGEGDGSTILFGPLNPNPYTYNYASGVTWNEAQIAKNLIVLVENVFQIANVNYTIVQNPGGDDTKNPGNPWATGTYIQFGTAVPANKPVYVIHKFDQ